SPIPRVHLVTPPQTTGVRISTCSFNLQETFQTSPDELYRTFINQEVPDQRIEMRWRFRTWPSGHYATVSLELEERGDETELRMACRGVPAGEENTTREGWTRFYFQAIRQTFGY
uniref:Activator of Hsp90 ATPase homologue 1/2-like C-terminal domain-containing protein n=1 Tax=Mola mola TaxID=94237 RepID=A0A3Q3WXS8_MOLML